MRSSLRQVVVAMALFGGTLSLSMPAVSAALPRPRR
jgi:hypothetical protein